MLQNIRDNIQGVAAKIIIGLMIVPFALYGIDFLFSGSSDAPVAVVNGEKVSEAELNQALALQKRQLLSMMGDNIDPGLLDDAVLRKPALDSLVRQKVMLQAADDAGVAVPDAVLNANIVQMTQFHENGRFSQERFRQVLAAQGFTPSLFRQLMRSDLLIEHLNRGVVGSAFLTDFQREQAIRLGDQKRSFHYLTLDSSGFAEQAEVSDADIEAYYQNNAARFKTTESVRVAYLELTIADFFKPVADEDLRAAYAAEVQAAKARTERHAAHILVELGGDRDREEARSRIEEAKAKIEQGADFAELAKVYSDDFGSAEQGGDLGYSAGNTFPEAFENALASLEVGETSDVVETDAGFHLVKLLDLRAPDVASFEDRREAIERELQERAAKPRLIAEVEALRDLVFNSDGLKGPAETLGLELKQSDWLRPNEGSGVLANPKVRAAAFNAELREQGYNSEVIEVSPTQFVVVNPIEYKAPELKPLATVRDQIVKQLKIEKGRAIAKSAAEEIAAALKAGESAEDIAKSREGVEWQVAVRAWRQDPAVAEPIRSAAFSLQRPEEGASRITTTSHAGNTVVIQLTNVYDGDKSLIGDKRRKELLASAERIQASQGFNAYFGELMQSAKIKYN